MKLTGNYDVVLQDWAGNDLFIGPVNDSELENIIAMNDIEDLSLFWLDESRTENVWEYV